MLKTALISYKLNRFIGPFLSRRLLGFYGGIGISYFGGYFFAGRATNVQGILPSIIFNMGNWELHLHHWIMSLAFFVLLALPLFIKRKINTPLFLFVFGFSIGLILQGVFSYSDWHSIITRRFI
jgi:hypothetical protein